MHFLSRILAGEYAVYLVQEQKKWGAVVKAIGFKAE